MEQWKDIPGFEGLYQASDLGRIRTCEGKETSNARYARRVWKQRILKQKCTKRARSQYYSCRVSLWKDGRETTHLVARLVAMTWCDGYADGMTVNHIDGNPMNNRIDNLEWVTLAENIRKGFAAGAYTTQKSVILVPEGGHGIRFRSLADASRYLGKNPGYLSCLIRRQRCFAGEYRVIIA